MDYKLNMSVLCDVHCFISTKHHGAALSSVTAMWAYHILCDTFLGLLWNLLKRHSPLRQQKKLFRHSLFRKTYMLVNKHLRSLSLLKQTCWGSFHMALEDYNRMEPRQPRERLSQLSIPSYLLNCSCLVLFTPSLYSASPSNKLLLNPSLWVWFWQNSNYDKNPTKWKLCSLHFYINSELIFINWMDIAPFGISTCQ